MTPDAAARASHWRRPIAAPRHRRAARREHQPPPPPQPAPPLPGRATPSVHAGSVAPGANRLRCRMRRRREVRGSCSLDQGDGPAVDAQVSRLGASDGDARRLEHRRQHGHRRVDQDRLGAGVGRRGSGRSHLVRLAFWMLVRGGRHRGETRACAVVALGQRADLRSAETHVVGEARPCHRDLDLLDRCCSDR